MQTFLASIIVSLLFVLRCLMPAFIIYGISRILINIGLLKEPACPPDGFEDGEESPDRVTDD